MSETCTCAKVDGFRIRAKGCPRHNECLDTCGPIPKLGGSYTCVKPVGHDMPHEAPDGTWWEPPSAEPRMTADHPTREERYAAVLRLHRLMARGLSNTEAECTCGGWRSGGLWDEAGKSFDSHVAAALVAADPAPAQPDAALSDGEWREFQNIPEQGYSHRAWVDARIQERILAARAAQPVPAPEVSRGVAEVKAEALREAADEWPGWWKFPAWLHDRADHIVRAAPPADDGADCCRERTTAGGCGCGGDLLARLDVAEAKVARVRELLDAEAICETHRTESVEGCEECAIVAQIRIYDEALGSALSEDES